MNTKSTSGKRSAEHVVKNIRRATRRHFSSEDKIRIVLDGLRGEDSIAELCRKEGIAQSLYYTWPKEFLEAGKRRLAGDTARAATTGEVQDLRRETRALKEAVADLKPSSSITITDATTKAAAFVPAVVTAVPPESAPKRPARPRKRKGARDAGVIELEIDGIAMRVGRGADAKTVAAVIRALKATS